MSKLNITVDKSQLTASLNENTKFNLIKLNREMTRRCVKATPSAQGQTPKYRKVTAPEIIDWTRMYLSGVTVPEIQEITGRDNTVVNRYLIFVFGARRAGSWVREMHEANRISNLMEVELEPVENYMTDAD